MDRMIPATAAIDESPMFDFASFWDEERNPVGIQRVRGPAIDLDGPWERRGLGAIGDALTIGLARIAVTRPSELHEPCPNWSDDRDLLCQHRRDLALIWRVCKVDYPRHINTRDLPNDPEFHCWAHYGIVGITAERLCQGQRLLGSAPVVAHAQPVHQLDPGPDRKPGEIDDNIVPLSNALVVQGRQSDGVDY